MLLPHSPVALPIVEFHHLPIRTACTETSRERWRLSELNAQRIRDVIALLEEYGGFACAFCSCRGAQAGGLVSAAGDASSLTQISECVP